MHNVTQEGAIREAGEYSRLMTTEDDTNSRGTLPAGSVLAAINSMTTARKSQLFAYARYAAGTSGFIDPAELISEAYVRIADGDRTCSAGEDPIKFLFGVVRSLASDIKFVVEVRHLRRVMQGASFVEPDDADLPSEDEYEAERQARIDRCAAAIDAKVKGDEEMELLVLGVRDGMRGAELEKLIGCDTKRLAALRTRLHRHYVEVCDVELSRKG